MSSGRVQRVTKAPPGSIDGAVGFGSIWLLRSIIVAKGGYGVPDAPVRAALARAKKPVSTGACGN